MKEVKEGDNSYYGRVFLQLNFYPSGLRHPVWEWQGFESLSQVKKSESTTGLLLSLPTSHNLSIKPKIL